jgi:hypothetical protein
MTRLVTSVVAEQPLRSDVRARPSFKTACMTLSSAARPVWSRPGGRLRRNARWHRHMMAPANSARVANTEVTHRPSIRLTVDLDSLRGAHGRLQTVMQQRASGVWLTISGVNARRAGQLKRRRWEDPLPKSEGGGHVLKNRCWFNGLQREITPARSVGTATLPHRCRSRLSATAQPSE